MPCSHKNIQLKIPRQDQVPHLMTQSHVWCHKSFSVRESSTFRELISKFVGSITDQGSNFLAQDFKKALSVRVIIIYCDRGHIICVWRDSNKDLDLVFISDESTLHQIIVIIILDVKISLGYSCALVGDILLQGHLYITHNYFAFYSNVFGYITRVRKFTTFST